MRGKSYDDQNYLTRLRVRDDSVRNVSFGWQKIISDLLFCYHYRLVFYTNIACKMLPFFLIWILVCFHMVIPSTSIFVLKLN